MIEQLPYLSNTLILKDRLDSLTTMAVLLDYTVESYIDFNDYAHVWCLKIEKGQGKNFFLLNVEVTYKENLFWRIDSDVYQHKEIRFVNKPDDFLIDRFFSQLVDLI